MPGMPVGAVHQNVPLTNLSRLYRPQEDGFVANDVCPMLPVQKESDTYYVWTQGDFFAVDVSDLVPDRDVPREIEFAATTESYIAQRRELAWTISDRERANADNQLRLEQTKQRGALGRLFLKREIRAAGILQASDQSLTAGGETISGQLDTTVDAAAAVKWDAATTDYQDVLTDVVAGITRMRQSIGIAPNVIVIPGAVAEGLHKSLFFSNSNGPQFVFSGETADAPHYTRYPLLPATLWGMRVLVPGQIYNSAVEGQSASYSDVWGEIVRMLYITPGPAIDTPSVAYTFQSEALATRQAREDKPRVDWFATGYTGVEKVTAPFAAAVITDCLT